jgi:hypothetical protein
LLEKKGFYYDLYMSQFRRSDHKKEAGDERQALEQMPAAQD